MGGCAGRGGKAERYRHWFRRREWGTQGGSGRSIYGVLAAPPRGLVPWCAGCDYCSLPRSHTAPAGWRKPPESWRNTRTPSGKWLSWPAAGFWEAAPGLRGTERQGRREESLNRECGTGLTDQLPRPFCSHSCIYVEIRSDLAIQVLMNWQAFGWITVSACGFTSNLR